MFCCTFSIQLVGKKYKRISLDFDKIKNNNNNPKKLKKLFLVLLVVELKNWKE